MVTMSNRKTTKKIVGSVLLVLAFSSIASFAQAKKISECSCRLDALYNRDGWLIPGLDGSAAKWPRASYKISGSETKIFVTRLKPGEKTGTITRLRCSDAGIEIGTLPLKVNELWAFDVSGKVFAYGVTGAWLGTDKAGHTKELGTASDVEFYDLDGSGKFILMKYSEFPFAPQVPEWVNRMSTGTGHTK